MDEALVRHCNLGLNNIFARIILTFEARSCGHPGDAQFADFHLDKGEDFVFGSKVVYTCSKGYENIYNLYSHCCFLIYLCAI